MESFFGYIRVSTVKQGTQGVSLQEQKASIEYYAQVRGFSIVEWYEERETAAKYGRPVFTTMMQRLTRREAAGVIMHKIDRSARNLRDWVELSELADSGLAVHFSNEGVDLSSTMSRYSADIHAASAAHYIRNLREETLKGLYGRLKQGLYPWQAPIGYLDQGRGKAKIVDPIQGPLVRRAFELYAQGTSNLKSLRRDMEAVGLRNKHGGAVSLNGLNRILRNTFYIGIIKVTVNGQTFKGVHEPLVSSAVFDRVQDVLDGKIHARAGKHDFTFRKLLSCKACGLSLIGERQKGRVYYRCHTKGCGASVREDVIEDLVVGQLSAMTLSIEEHEQLLHEVNALRGQAAMSAEEVVRSLGLKRDAAEERLNRLTDALIDGMIAREDHGARRSGLLREIRAIEEQIARTKEEGGGPMNMVDQFLERAKSLEQSYIFALPHEKRDFLRDATSNRVVSGKNVEIAWLDEYRALAERPKLDGCDHLRDVPRTHEYLLRLLMDVFTIR
jgi:DNA invertase Pin-like site-specific DNA recombinase